MGTAEDTSFKGEFEWGVSDLAEIEGCFLDICNAYSVCND